MYDVEKLVSIVCDYLDAEADYMKYSLDARKEEHFGRHLRHAGHQSGIAGGRCQIHATQGTP